MLCKYVLTVDSISYDIPKSCIQNWDEIKFSRKRSGLEGITRTFTSKFQFVGKAYALILEEYLSKYLASNASITVYTITNSHTYNEFFSCRLDFGSLTYDGNTVSINSIDDSVANIIKTNKGTQYEYSVDEIKDVYQFYYDRLNMQNLLNFTIDDTYVINPIELADVYVYSYNTEMVKGGYLDFDTGEKGVIADILDVPSSGINAYIDMDVEYENSGYGEYIDLTLSTCGNTQVERVFKGESKNVKLSVRVDRNSFNAYGQRKMFYFSISMKASHTTYANFRIKKINEFKITYCSIDSPIHIDVITPKTVLCNLLKSMNGGNDGIKGEIDYGYNENLDNCVILAAESIRGIKKAKLYTSYTKFKDWMEAEFGFVPVINGNTVCFKHRSSLFSNNNIKNLASNFSDFEYKIDSSKIHSRIRVGYDKQDYESINGRDEFRFTTEYTTGVDITDNVLELISPYRADVYGIEFLAQKRGKDTTDNESDNDVFFVGVNFDQGDNKYKVIRDGWRISGVLDSSRMFNTMYWQVEMLKANAGYIGMFAKKLSYSSSDGNSDVVVNGIGMKDDFNVESGIITCGDVSFTTYDENIPLTDDETIKILKDGLVYEGYIKEVSRVIERFAGVKYDLFVRSITKV